MSATRDDVIRFFRDVLNIDPPTDDMDLIEDGVLDSLVVVELILYLEQQCNARVDVEALDFADLRTIPAICRLVERNRSSASTPLPDTR